MGCMKHHTADTLLLITELQYPTASCSANTGVTQILKCILMAWLVIQPANYSREMGKLTDINTFVWK